MVELVWEYSAQMEARQLTNAFEYVARCRHWKQFQFDRQHAIQSLPSSASGPTEAHLPVRASGSFQQQWSNSLSSTTLASLPTSEQHQHESSSTGPSISSTQAVASAGVLPPPGTHTRAREQAHTSTGGPSAIDGETAGQVAGVTATQPPASFGSQESALQRSASDSPRRSAEQQSDRALSHVLLPAEADSLREAEAAAAAEKQQNASQSRRAANVSRGKPQTNSEFLCSTCQEQPLNVVLVPCGHLTLCSWCTERCKDCPVCRRPIRGTVRINYSH